MKSIFTFLVLLLSLQTSKAETIEVVLPDRIEKGKTFPILIPLPKTLTPPFRVSQFIPLFFSVVRNSNNIGTMKTKPGLLTIAVESEKKQSTDTLRFWAISKQEGLFRITARLSFLNEKNLQRLYFDYDLTVQNSKQSSPINVQKQDNIAQKLMQHHSNQSKKSDLQQYDNYNLAGVEQTNLFLNAQEQASNAPFEKSNASSQEGKKERELNNSRLYIAAKLPQSNKKEVDKWGNDSKLSPQMAVDSLYSAHEEALASLEMKQNTVEGISFLRFSDFKKEGRTFWVQLEMSPFGDKHRSLTKKYGINRTIRVVKDQFAFYYFIGPFATFDLAFDYSFQLNNKNSIDTFPIEFKNGKRIRH